MIGVMILAARLDWGLGNPNKTGALIAALIPLVWGVAIWLMRGRGCARKRALFGGAVLLSGGLGVALLLTESRGGILTALISLALLTGFAPRPWSMGRVAIAGLAFFAAFLIAANIGATRRLEPGHLAGDDSIRNRLSIWAAVPSMLADAPDGWGKGNAGPEYGRWYQPAAFTQPYRVLVSSHLTILAESGRRGRIAYVALWLLGLMVAWRAARTEKNAAPLALIAGQLAAWQFSDVAEAALVFWLPVSAGIVALGLVCRQRDTRGQTLCQSAWALAFAAILCLGMEIGWRGKTGLNKEDGFVRMAGNLPGVLHVLPVRGSKAPSPREWREAFPERATRPTLIWWERSPAEDTVKNGSVLFFGGASFSEEIPAAPVLVFVNPREGPEALLPPKFAGRAYVFFGEFARKTARSAWEACATVNIVEDQSDYMPDWPGRTTALEET